MFDADRPITKKEQDRLDRSVFATYLARCLLDHQDQESLVVGLYGGWGVGKTSVINLLMEELGFASTNLPEENQPIILNFSVWSYSGQHQLIYSFFRRLSATLRTVPNLEDADHIIYLLELYVSFFTQKPPQPLRKRSWWQKLTFQHHENSYAWESGRDLTLVKLELNEYLKKLNRKIIIIIDNISRLYDYEIKQLFQIVKSMGDYYNTIYLLSFDKDYVVRAINQLDGRGGEEYVEKIVQLPFKIPPILQSDVESILADRLQKIIDTVPKESWNIEYWADMYYGSLKYFFENCRDITRYVNTLNFGYSRLRDVVNPVDFFALTALEVFTPHVYYGIRENKDLFTDLLDNVYVLDREIAQKDKSRCEEILARSQRIPREVALDLMMRLFPRIRRLYLPDEAFYHSDAIARKLRRICSPDIFDVYFRLSMQVGQIPQSEFDAIMAISTDAELFDQALARLNQDGRITKFLDMLDGKALTTIPRHNIQAIVTALLDNGDLFPQGLHHALSLDMPMRLHRIIHALLQRFHDPDERFLLLQNAIASANKSLYTLVYELQEQSREHIEETDTYLPREFRDLNPEQLDSLQKLAVSRIQLWANNGSLIDHPHLLEILYAWRNFGEEGEVNAYVEKATQTDRGLLSFLLATQSKAIDQAMTSYQKTPEWDACLAHITAFVPAQTLAPHAKALFEDEYFEKLREREQLALMIFLDLIKTPTKKSIRKTTR